MTHPLGPCPPKTPTDIAPAPRYTDNIHEPMPAEQESSTFSSSTTSHRSSVIQPRKSGLTFAQKLYASSFQDPGSLTTTTAATGILTPPASPPSPTSTFASSQEQPTRVKHRHSNTLGPGTYHYLDTSGLHSRSLNASNTPVPSHPSTGHQVSSPHQAPHRAVSHPSVSSAHDLNHNHRASTLPTNDFSSTRLLKTTCRPPLGTPPAEFPAVTAPLSQLKLQNTTALTVPYPSPPGSLPSPLPAFQPNPDPSPTQHTSPPNLASSAYPSPPISHASPTFPQAVNAAYRPPVAPTSTPQQQQVPPGPYVPQVPPQPFLAHINAPGLAADSPAGATETLRASAVYWPFLAPITAPGSAADSPCESSDRIKGL
jgi:hypothetical protein